MKLHLKVPAKDLKVKTSNARNIKRAIKKASPTQVINFGTPVKATSTDSCINCTLYLRCLDPKKSRDFRCSNYAPILSTFTKQMAAIRENVTSENYEVFQDFDDTDLDPKAKKKASKSISIEDEETADRNNDFLKLVDSMIAEQELAPVPRDLKIDDRDMPMARNYFEWITSKRFLNMEMDPFAKQVETGINLFAEWCPRCSNKDYALCVPTRDKPRHILEEVQLLQYGVCPKCKGTKEEFYRKHELNVPCELVGLGGQRGTKSTQTAMMITYHTHTYMKLQNPSQVFKLLNNQILHGQLSALTWQGAKELLFDPIRDMIVDSPWFQQYHAMLDYYGNKYGQELYKLKDIFYSNRARKLTLYPIGPDRKKMRGRTSYCAAIDEIGLMDSEDNSNKVKMNADEVYTSVRNALQTLRVFYYKSILKKGKNSVLPPIMCCISSPLSKRDKIVRLREEALKNPRRMYSFHYATWEMNPRFTKKDLLEELNGDVAKLMRDFGAVPPNSSLPYIDDVELARPIISKRHQNVFDLIPTVRRSEGKKGKTYRAGKLSPNVPRDTQKRIIAMDAGYNNNSFAIVGGYYDTEEDKPVIDIMLELMPTMQYPINYNYIYEDVISPIIEQANGQLLLADRWQNLKIMHDAEKDHGCEIENYSVKYPDFVVFKEELIIGNFMIPRPEMGPGEVEAVGDKSYPQGFVGKPISHFIYQLIGVQDHGKEVTKGDEVTDDILRASVLLHAYLIDMDYRELCSGNTGKVNKRSGVPGFVGLRSQGAAAGSPMGNYGSMGAVGSLSTMRR